MSRQCNKATNNTWDSAMFFSGYLGVYCCFARMGPGSKHKLGTKCFYIKRLFHKTTQAAEGQKYTIRRRGLLEHTALRKELGLLGKCSI